VKNNQLKIDLVQKYPWGVQKKTFLEGENEVGAGDIRKSIWKTGAPWHFGTVRHQRYPRPVQEDRVKVKKGGTEREEEQPLLCPGGSYT